MGSDGLEKEIFRDIGGHIVIYDWAVFGNLDCSSGPISQKYEFSTLAMPSVLEKVMPSLMILFIRLPRFFFLLLIIGPRCFHRL